MIKNSLQNCSSMLKISIQSIFHTNVLLVIIAITILSCMIAWMLATCYHMNLSYCYLPSHMKGTLHQPFNPYTHTLSSNLVSHQSVWRRQVCGSMVFAVIDQVSIDLCTLTGSGWKTRNSQLLIQAVSDIIAVSNWGWSKLTPRAQEHGLTASLKVKKKGKRGNLASTLHW